MKFTGPDLIANSPDGQRAPTADTAPGRPDGIAVSPAIGPLPAIYVPRTPGEATSTGLLWQATARAVRQVSGWAARRLSA
jgi:hypothetical protein